MNNKAYSRDSIKTMNALLLVVAMVVLTNCSPEKVGETARSGQMSLAVDRQLGDSAGSQIETFKRYYPDARITLIPSPSGTTLKHLLSRNARAALISGDPESAEDSLFATLHPPLRREPVARDAIVCIVNRLNPVSKFSLSELKSLYSGKEKEGVTPLLTADDYRLRSVIAAGTGMHKKDIRARVCKNETELIQRVSSDSKAVGLLFRSSLDEVLNAGKAEQSVRIIPLARDSEGFPPCQPTQQNIFEGRYPLVTTVYYIYYSGDALAAGFGSWLSSSGQKAFERSSLAPYRPFERTVILK